MSNFNGFIYCAKNLINNKVYIGKTTCFDVIKYCRSHIYNALNHKSKNKYFYKAIRKHNPSNFLWSIIDYSNSLEDLNNKEKYWIKYYNSTNNLFGYNIASGGEGGNTRLGMSEENLKKYKEKISTTLKNLPIEEKIKRNQIKSKNQKENWKNETYRNKILNNESLKQSRKKLGEKIKNLWLTNREEMLSLYERKIKKHFSNTILKHLTNKFLSYEDLLIEYPIHVENMRNWMKKVINNNDVSFIEVQVCKIKSKTHHYIKYFTYFDNEEKRKEIIEDNLHLVQLRKEIKETKLLEKLKPKKQIIRSEEHKKAISESNRKRIIKFETKEKQRLKATGRVRTKESIQKGLETKKLNQLKKFNEKEVSSIN